MLRTILQGEWWSAGFWKCSCVIHVRKKVNLALRITGFTSVRVTIHHGRNREILNQPVSNSLFPHLPINLSLAWKLLLPTEPHLSPIPLDARSHFKSNFFSPHRFSFHFVFLYILFDKNCFFVILLFFNSSKFWIVLLQIWFTGQMSVCLFHDVQTTACVTTADV